MDIQLIKRYLISAAITFAAGFAFVFVAGVDGISVEGVKNGTLLGLILAATRAGIKAALEGFLVWYGNRK